jgi:hypothetical protein
MSTTPKHPWTIWVAQAASFQRVPLTSPQLERVAAVLATMAAQAGFHLPRSHS